MEGVAAVAAVEEHGVRVEFGPFGSSCSVAETEVGTVVASLLRAAYGNGATHVSVHVAPEAAL